jgi:F-type H+-transporting ATPase subunit a
MIFHQLEHLLQVSWVVQASLAAGVLLVLAGVAVRRRLAEPSRGIVPDEGVSLRNVVEATVEALAKVAQDRIGPEYRRYFPIIGTMFFFILVSNLMGLVPGFDGATASGNATWAWAIIAWITYTAIGIVKHRGKYLLKFMGPALGKHHIRWLAWFFLPLEVLLDLARMLTLAVRLMANMFADHTVIAVWLLLVPFGVPAIFMGLGIIIALLQAFVFALLTMIYIGLALEEPH